VRGMAAALIALASSAVVVIPASASIPGPATAGDFAGLIQIPGGRSLYLECHGSGGPTVIFEAGLRSRGDYWGYSTGGPGTGPFPLVFPFTRACIYDRPGTVFGQVSRSDPVPMPRTTGEIADDLHALLGAAGVPPPYVLVGASTGGLIAREYSSLYPGEVAGMVLVDAISEGVQRFLKPGQFALYNQAYLQSVMGPESLYPDLESIDFYGSFAEMRQRRRPPRQIPMLVLSSEFGFGPQPGTTPGFGRVVNRAWRRAQRYLSTLEPGVKRVIASGSGHQISINEPALVARMTLRVVAAVRSGHRRLTGKRAE
jgi:pimeloyl-ACP methyl ester carboxylesterase